MPDDLPQFMREVDPVMDQDRFLYSMARFLIEGDEREEARMLLACSCETGKSPAGTSVMRLDLTRTMFSSCGSTGRARCTSC
jgi:hypothetical protein